MGEEEPEQLTTNIIIPKPKPKRTLLEKWRNYLRGIPSPDNYINFGFYYLISAALQRRVWTGASHEPLFGNLYCILCGRPGIGKGRVITPVNTILRYHKVIPKIEDKEQKILDGKKVMEKAMAALGMTSVVANSSASQKDEPKGIFNLAPDSTTYQSLLREISKATRAHVYVDGNGKKGIYTHATVAFALEELSSLFRRNCEEINNFLLTTYDCKDYRYSTISRGDDEIKKCCVSFLAGTTPDFMQEVFGDAILTQGFASRTNFIFAAKNRFNVLFQDELDEQQQQDFQDILDWVKKLSEIYGYAKLTPEALDFMRKWWEIDQSGIKKNFSPKLEHYYARKNINVLKFAMAFHFADSLSMEITLDDCKNALDFLDKEEPNMHYALSFDRTNPLAKIANKVEQILSRRGAQTMFELLFECFSFCKESEMRETLNAMVAFGKIKAVNKEGTTETAYQWIPKEERKEVE